VKKPYTPGFSRPEMHRQLFHIPTDIFPLAPPAPAPEVGTAGNN